jgi:hypothetical protein
VRPLQQHEAAAEESIQAVNVSGTKEITLHMHQQRKSISCQYDAVLGPQASQEDVYELLRRSTASVLEGFHSTIFAYGQTGSGKTFTMFGPPEQTYSDAHRTSLGVIPRAVSELFEHAAKKEIMEFSVFCSFVQIYNEQVRR